MAAAPHIAPPAHGPRRTLAGWLAWYALANTAVFLLVGISYLRVAGWPGTAPAQAYLAFTFLGHFAFLAAAVALPAGLLAAAWPNRTAVTALAVALFSVAGGALWLDTVVFKLYRFHLNGMVWSLIVNGGLTEILPLTVGTWLTVAGAAVLAVLLQLALSRACTRWCARPRRGGLALAAALAALLIASHLLHAWADATNHTQLTRLARNFPAMQPLTAERFIRRLGFAVHPEDTSVHMRHDSALHYPLAPLTGEPPARPPNLLLVVIDAWRYDMLTEAATPNVWRFAQDSLRFTNHSSAANSTRFGIFTLLYGLYGDYWHAMLAEQRGPVLLDEMLRARYEFGIYGSARLTSPEFDRTTFAQIRDRIPLRTEGDTPPARDAEITRQFLDFLGRRDAQRPFFGFVFYDSTHAYDYPPGSPEPFQPVAGNIHHLELDRNVDPVPVRNRFLNATHCVDAKVGEILDRLGRDGLLSNTVVVITGDHGQEFNETGQNAWGHNSNFSRYQVNVPFVVRWPGRGSGEVAHLTSHLDLAPTFLREALGCTSPPEQYSNGRMLFDAAPRIPLVASTWEGVALISPGRVDVMNPRGAADHFDADYRPIATPTPPGLVAEAMRGLSRFYAR